MAGMEARRIFTRKNVHTKSKQTIWEKEMKTKKQQKKDQT
jgi:hypothetical protein